MTLVSGNPFDIDINSGFNPGRFKSISEQSAVNLFEFENAMLPTAGFERILPTIGGSAEGRGIFYSDTIGKCVVVIGNVLYAVTEIDHQELGQLMTLKGKVYFAENGETSLPDTTTGNPGGQLVISDGVNIYVYTLDGAFIKARDDFGDELAFTPGTIIYQNSFFFINDLDSRNIFASNINEARIWPVLNRSTISEQSVSCLAFKNKLYVFGTDKTSVFYDNAAEFFPYSQDVNKAWEYGCFSQASLAASTGMMAWLGNSRDSSPTVLASLGGNPMQISTPGIDAEINALPNQQDCDGFIYEEHGHAFYQLNFYTDNLSLLYDFTTQKWSKLTSFNKQEAHQLMETAYFKNKNQLMGVLKLTGEVVNVGLSIFTYNGEIVPRTLITQNYTQKERNFIIKEVDLQIEQGENDETSKICFSISKDRGRTYPLLQVVELGNAGDRKNLLRFRQLGAARWWTFKWDFFSTQRFVILSAQGWIQS